MVVEQRKPAAKTLVDASELRTARKAVEFMQHSRPLNADLKAFQAAGRNEEVGVGGEKASYPLVFKLRGDVIALSPKQRRNEVIVLLGAESAQAASETPDAAALIRKFGVTAFGDELRRKWDSMRRQLSGNSNAPVK